MSDIFSKVDKPLTIDDVGQVHVNVEQYQDKSIVLRIFIDQLCVCRVTHIDSLHINAEDILASYRSKP